MFEITRADIDCILRDFNIPSEIDDFIELQRYNYETRIRNRKRCG